MVVVADQLCQSAMEGSKREAIDPSHHTGKAISLCSLPARHYDS
jgi:hypothetical protein